MREKNMVNSNHKLSIWGWLKRLILAVIIIALIVLGYVAYKQGVVGSINRAIVLPTCSSATNFNQAPLDLTKVQNIVPLGNVSPPDHTLPTDHLYFYMDPSVEATPLIAPGKIYITNLEYSSEKINGQFSHPGDYSISFTNCRGLTFEFAHIKSLAGPLGDKAQSLMKSCEHNQPAAGEITTYCNQPVNILVSSSTQIGIIGTHGNASAIDFNANLRGHKDPGAVSPTFDGTDAVCGLDYFSKAIQEQLYTKVKRTAEPRCGQIGQDINNTIQGAWTANSKPSVGKNQWNTHLAIVHFNLNPSIGLIALGGGSLGQPGGLSFKPRTSGIINLEPSQTEVGKTYCYQDDHLSNVPIQQLSNQNQPDHLLIRLVNNHQLQIELQLGACQSSPDFTNPISYYR